MKQIAALCLRLLGRWLDSVALDRVAETGYRFAANNGDKDRFEALAPYDSAIALNPDDAVAHNNRGRALFELKQFDAAMASFERAIALKPDYAEAYNNRANVLQQKKRFGEALANYERAIALKPDLAAVYMNRGNVLQNLGRLDEALASYERAIALKPDYARAHNNRANVLKQLRRLDEALTSYERAIALEPDYAEAYSNKSLLKLLTGDFDEGWELYEWRWKHQLKEYARNFAKPLWLGRRPIAGQTLLIHAEQGLGDAIQCCRYAAMAEAMGANVILEVPASLVSLISTLKGHLTIVEKGQPLPAFDLHCPIMSLPLAFKTTVATIPAAVPYLYADSGKQKLWQERLGVTTRLRVGLVWSGSTAYNEAIRSIPLDLLKPLLELPAEFHALQKEIRSEDAAHLPNFSQLHIHQDELADFSDTAAVIQEMDLVISVDTSTAHLAGAMGKPVWILLPFMADFRWLLDRTDSPWYPTATLFRQPANGDWNSVIGQIAERLKAMTHDR